MTIGREAGQTCARVRAARTSAHANAGVWSGFSSTVCGSTLTPTPSSPTNLSGTFYRGSGTGGDNLSQVTVSFSAVSGATSYQFRYRAQRSTGSWDSWSRTQSVSSGRTTLNPCQPGAVTGVKVSVRAGNSAGWSSWRVATAAVGGFRNACM